ncbi:MAG TPA: enoyl-CoA hydratase-related protein [Candidatus Eisenbacteria bacterium]|nr:enoyl-CoA hydratase-related protein [Candidatus Eisenbacteria bacterium]
MEFKLIIYEKAEGIATITLNRPEALNAFSKELVAEVLQAVEEARADENVRVVILTGAGEKAFSAGADIKAMIGMTALKARELSLMGEKLCLAFENLEKPVVAAINGYALGGGMEVSMSCDIRIASESAKMGQTEVNIGLIPGWGGTQRLTRLVGPAKAKELVFSGKIIDAKTAEQLGIVNMVAPADKFRENVRQFALDLAAKAPVALKVAKALINKGADMSLDSALELEREGFGVVASTEDLQEGVKAFTEKRKATFKGK